MHGLPEGIILLFSILALVYAVLLFLLPIYVFNIRNILIKQNKLLEQVIVNTSAARRPVTSKAAAADK